MKIEHSTKFEVEKGESVNMMNMTVQTQEEKIIAMNSEDFQNIDDLNVYIEQQIIKMEGVYRCKICSKSSNKKSNTKEHVEMHINGLNVECNFCSKAFSSRNSLRSHKKRYCMSARKHYTYFKK